MKHSEIRALSKAIDAFRAAEPGLCVDVRDKQVTVGFWFETATGRTYACAIEPTFEGAFKAALDRRERKIAEAVVEAEIRAEIQARMAEAA